MSIPTRTLLSVLAIATVSAFLAIFGALPLIAQGPCSLSGKIISYVVTLCSEQGCETGRERIDIIGDQVLVSDSATQSVGDVYYLGKTVDLAKDKNQSDRWTTSPHPELEFLASATASYDGTDLKLKIEQLQRARKGTLPPGQFTQTIIIRILDCKTCAVLATNIITTYRGSILKNVYMKHNPSCHITTR